MTVESTPVMEPVYFLMVDDLEENLLSLEALLRRDGLVLLRARSGPEALELLLKHDVALALLDVQMPGMDGFELAELMRGTERTRRIPIIFLTASNINSQRRFRGYETGAVAFLEKPIEPDMLRNKAEVFFELYRQRQMLAQQHDRLSHYTEALKEADRRKDEFLATLAHELRNPLAPIRNGLQILRMDKDSEHAEDVREMMDRQLTHLVRLIDDLLDVSRISQGKIDLRKDHIPLRIAVEAAVEASRPLIDAKAHTLKINLPPQELWLDADLTRIAQVISNLLNNAAKYTPESGHITLTATQHQQQVTIAIADNGLGIPKDMMPHVFELFTQLDRDLERSQGGLGIGLALVKRLVAMHEGTLIAESEGANRGSTFKITLPLTTPKEMPVQLQDAADQAQVKPLRVLVVDDNIASAKTTGWMLEMIGHASQLTHDGISAVTVAKEYNPDVILLDIGLPGMSGYDVCRELRKQPAFKNTMMIAQTGWGQAKDRQQAYDAGFDHHLVKPVEFEKLAQLLGSTSIMEAKQGARPTQTAVTVNAKSPTSTPADALHSFAHMNHELRTPMNAIIGLSGILKTMQSQMPEKAGQCLDALQSSADDMMKLLNQLADAAKTESKDEVA